MKLNSPKLYKVEENNYYDLFLIFSRVSCIVLYHIIFMTRTYYIYHRNTLYHILFIIGTH
jgi:hypothetical protein